MYILNKGEKNMSITQQKLRQKMLTANLKFVSKKTFYKHNKPNTNQQYMLVYPPYATVSQALPFPVPQAMPYLLVTTLQNFRKAVQRNQTSLHPIVAAPTTFPFTISNNSPCFPPLSYSTSAVCRSLPQKYYKNYTVALIPQSKQKQFYNAYTLNNNVKYL